MNITRVISKLFRYKRPNPELNNLTSGKTYNEKYNDVGVFEYYNEGFSIQYEEISTKIKWDDITQLNVYKADLFTIDRIEMQIIFGDRMITISEDLPGWYQFVIKTKNIFPTIQQDWDSNIAHPPFKTNWTTIYEKGKPNLLLQQNSAE